MRESVFKKNGWGYWGALIGAGLALCFSVALLYPLYFALAEAVWNKTDGFTLRHIFRLFESGAPQWRWLLNSLALAGLATAACCVVAYPLAYLQSRTVFRGQNLLGSLLLLPLIVPPFVARSACGACWRSTALSICC